MFAPPAGLSVVPGLAAPVGPAGGLHLLLHPLLPGLRILLLRCAGGAGRLRRPVSLGVAARLQLLQITGVSGVLPGVLRDLPPQLEDTD